MTTFDPRTVHPAQAQQFGTPRPDAAQFRTGQSGPQTSSARQFAGSVPPPLGQPSRQRPKPGKAGKAGKIVAGAVAAALVLGGAGTWIALSSSPAQAAVQSTSFAGANPTTSPFGTDAPQVAAVAATGPQSGDTAGLYAATTPPSCTTADFLSQLQADPAKLAAFGGVFGLGAGDVPAFVDSLSPVVLRANTSVTDHPYADGAFTEQPAILAAGTAVLVNSYGEPTVKCFNGNPLTGGALSDTAVTVTPTTQVIAQFSFTSVDNSRVVVVPGKPDPKPNKGPNPDPFLQAKADAAAQLAKNARTAATTARADADQAAQAQKDAQTRDDDAATTLQNAAAALKAAGAAVPFDQAAFDIAQRNAIQASIAKHNADLALQTAKDKATSTDKNAKDLEDKATADEQAAAKAKQEADDSKHPHAAKPADQDGNKGDAAKVQPPTTDGQEGQALTGQTQPAQSGTAGGTTATTACPTIVTAATATPQCPAPAGSADAATTPATGTTKGGDTGSAAKTGATGTGSSKSSGSEGSGSSSSSTGGSQKTSKEGSDY